jgi:glucose-1-phosphate cytidylyltransferase
VLEPDSTLEREPLEGLARRGQLRAYRHDGFWGCLDTYKDAVALNDLWAAGAAPWALWERNRRASRGRGREPAWAPRPLDAAPTLD